MAATRMVSWRFPAAASCIGGTHFRRGLSQCSKLSGIISSRKQVKRAKVAPDSYLKRRTRSDREFDHESVRRYVSEGDHIPVMLGEVLEVFGRPTLRSFVDCTVGAAGHSSAIIRAHSELELYIGMDVDYVACEKARNLIAETRNDNLCARNPNLKTSILLKNFRDVRSIFHEIDQKLLDDGVDGILMDLGMSSMQVNNAKRGFSVLNSGPLDMRMNPEASLKAEDIVNSWPEAELGRILREYGEESNWHYLQTKIVKARSNGGLHSTDDLVDLIRNTSRGAGGRQGWIKTATRVFQALRIAVNDELMTLEDALYACFSCLSSGGRLAVISFHSLEDRIVKKTFLNIIHKEGDDPYEGVVRDPSLDKNRNSPLEEPWIKQRIEGINGIILTKRPITPSEEEEKLNRRCRSAKLRVIEKT